MKTYQVRTYGCQMNVHDSERLSGLLESAGYVDIAGVPDPAETADVVVFNTCAVRENADNKLYGNLGQLRPAKLAEVAVQLVVCVLPHCAGVEHHDVRSLGRIGDAGDVDVTG